MFQIERGQIDASGRCRTWKLTAPNGTPLAEITRKREAKYLADVLTALTENHLKENQKS